MAGWHDPGSFMMRPKSASAATTTCSQAWDYPAAISTDPNKQGY